MEFHGSSSFDALDRHMAGEGLASTGWPHQHGLCMCMHCISIAPIRLVELETSYIPNVSPVSAKTIWFYFFGRHQNISDK